MPTGFDWTDKSHLPPSRRSCEEQLILTLKQSRGEFKLTLAKSVFLFRKEEDMNYEKLAYELTGKHLDMCAYKNYSVDLIEDHDYTIVITALKRGGKKYVGKICYPDPDMVDDETVEDIIVGVIQQINIGHGGGTPVSCVLDIIPEDADISGIALDSLFGNWDLDSYDSCQWWGKIRNSYDEMFYCLRGDYIDYL